MEIEVDIKSKDIKLKEEEMKVESKGLEESKSKLFKHWEQYVEKNEKLKTLEKYLASEKMLLDERER
jgi:hypothetical protein